MKVFLFLFGGYGRSIGNVLYLHNSPNLCRTFKTSKIITTLASIQRLEFFADNRYLHDISPTLTIVFIGLDRFVFYTRTVHFPLRLSCTPSCTNDCRPI